ncbi:YkgJ family cysteine cluster protein [Geobacter argillaceus]|nr:YkgJ family cysteine cluster protein [Geobacter argillaceus]
MKRTIIMDALANYRILVANVDALCERIAAVYGNHIKCAPGCDACCRHLTLFPVEAYALAKAVNALAEPLRTELRAEAASTTPEAPCPLLRESTCLLYDARPLICRTHGFPILLETADGTREDHCPRNFQGLASLPGNAVIQLERLNEALATVNALFLQNIPAHPDSGDRLTIARAILLTPLSDD